MEQFLALNASAGSGKTYALTLRYISLLFLDAHPNTILTLTFTNKAASEMKERIFKTLINLGVDNKVVEEISNQTNLKPSEIILNKNNVIERFLSTELHITTIDTFVNKILREFCGYIDLNDDFIIDNDDYDLMIYKFLLSLSSEHFEILINFSHTNEKKLNSIIDLFILLDDKNITPEVFEFSKELLNILENDILENGYKIRDFILNADLSSQAKNSVNFNNIKSFLNVGKTWLAKNNLNEYSYFKKAKIPKQIEEEFLKIKSNLSLYFKYKEIGILNSLFAIFNNFKIFRYKYKKTKNSLQFNDVTNLVYDLLQNNIDKDFLSFRLDAIYNHILIDEFQDTSVVQYKILEPLIDEILSGSHSAGKFKTFFYVGDTKQSIYRFRGGKKELFDFVRDKHKESIKLKILDKNFRSSKNIVNFVNSTFINIQNYKYHKQFVESDIEGFVEIVEIDILSEKKYEETNIKEFGFLKDKINELMEKGIDPNNITILTYTNNDVLNLYEYLSSVFKDINIVTDMTSKIINQRDVKAIINLIKYFYFKNDIYKENFNSLMGFGLLNKIELEVDIKNIDLILLAKKIASHYNILQENVIKFIEDLNKYIDIVDFVYEIDKNDTLMINSQNIGLQILTIFKSKGLEFDTVLLVDRIKNKNTDKTSLLFEYNGINLSKIYYKNKIREEFDIDYKKAIEYEKNQILNDEINVLYVALTRAKNNLIIFKKAKQSVFDVLGNISVGYKLGELFVNNESRKQNNFRQDIRYMPLKLGMQDLNNIDIETNSDDIKSKYFGLATHYCLEMMSSFDKNSIKSSMDIARNKFSHILNSDDFVDIENRVNNLVNNRLFLSIVKNNPYKKEQSLIYDNELKIIDLLICRDTSFTIIDYKTTINKEDTHIAQVKNYMRYIKAITSLETDGYIVYLQKNNIEIVQVD